MTKIVFFATIFKYRVTGINNLILGIIYALINNSDIEIILIGNKEFHKDVLKKIPKNNKIKIIIDRKANIFTGGFFLNRLLKKETFDFIFAPAGVLPYFLNKKIKKIVYIHDFIYKTNSNTMSLKVKLIMKLFGDYSVKKADLLWANSLYTMDEANFFFNLKDKKTLIGASIDKNLFKVLNFKIDEKEKMKKKYGIKRKSLLFVGTLEPRKNIDFLIQLMPELEKKNFQLLVVGGKGWGDTRIKEQLENLNLKNETINFLGYLTDEELVELYNIIDIYISTSKNEGLGLPQLEAMSCGCPVISPHNSAMIEVVSGAGETVDNWNSYDWIKKVEMVYSKKDDYSKKSILRVSEYDWDNVIHKFLYLLGEKNENKPDYGNFR